MATGFAMLSTGRISPQNELGEAGRVQTHSGYQPLKNNIKGRTKNTDSIISKGRESGVDAGQRDRGLVLRATGQSLLPGAMASKSESQLTAHLMRSPGTSSCFLCPLTSFPLPSPVFPQIYLIWVKRIGSFLQAV